MSTLYPRVRAGSPAASTRGRLARAHQTGADAATIAALEAQLREDVIADYIDRVLATAPPLSAEARSRLAALLTPATPQAQPGSAA